MLMPASAAARMMEVPTGTWQEVPSMVTCTVSTYGEAGVPKSRSRWMMVSSMVSSGSGLGSRLFVGRKAEILREVLQGRQHRVGGHAAQRAQRAGQHGVAQVA